MKRLIVSAAIALMFAFSGGGLAHAQDEFESFQDQEEETETIELCLLTVRNDLNRSIHIGLYDLTEWKEVIKAPIKIASRGSVTLPITLEHSYVLGVIESEDGVLWTHEFKMEKRKDTIIICEDCKFAEWRK